MAIDYNKLTLDLNEAKEACLTAAKGSDGGTCNFDRMILTLPRANEAKTVEAIKAAGLSGRKGTYLGSTVYHVNPIGCGQGSSRTRGAEAMYREMKARGWDASVYYQMD